MRPEPAPTEWVKSSHSNGDGGACVEWAPAHAAATGTVPVRDSKDTSRPAVYTTRRGWTTFVRAVANDTYPTT